MSKMSAGWMEDPAKALAEMPLYSTQPMGVKVGVLDNAQDYPDGTDVAMVAALHELDPSSRYNKWLLKSIEEVEPAMTKSLMKLMKKTGAGKNRRKRAIEEWGDGIAYSVGNTIRKRGITLPDNKPSTLANKDGSVPMVDTGHLASIIDSEVVSG